MLIMALWDLQNLPEVVQAAPDAVIFGLKGFSLRTRADLDCEQFSEVTRALHEKGIQVFANAQAMLEENRVPQAKEAFEGLLKAGVDGIYTADEGWMEMALEKNCMDKIIFQPETLVCSGQEARFYRDLGVQAVSLAHELSFREIADCAKQSDGLEVLIAGNYSWMDSRRPLIENYLRTIGKEEVFADGKIFWIQEMKREAKLPVIQDEKGTHVLSGEPLFSDAWLLKLKDAGIERMRVDALVSGNLQAIEDLQRARAILNGESAEEYKAPIGSDALYGNETVLRKED